MGIENYETEQEFYVVYVKHIGVDIDYKNIYHIFCSNKPEEVFAEGWGEVPACNVNRALMDINDDMYQHIVEVKTVLQLDLAQDCCCFSMQDARDNILALAYENIDYAETYPEPRIVIHFGDLIDDIELFFAKRDISIIYIK